MSNEKRFIYMPRERRSVLLRVCSILFCLGTVLMWISRDKFGFEKGDLLIMSGVAVLLVTLSVMGGRAERRASVDSETLRRIREETGKGDYNSDIFFDK
ncbi:MAG: hypothetical protein K2N60_12840 [Oscillospiraceae bacterium]|nr:hypothetical protein [Oscillospiraceae bacterium]